MPLHDIQRQSSPDFSDAAKLAEALMRHADDITKLAEANAKARTILEFSGDRRKVALAIAFKKAKQAGATSASEAEHFARASEEYQTALASLETDHVGAETVSQQYRAAETKFEALRTATSLQKAIAAQI